jgi:hypothetical protein
MTKKVKVFSFKDNDKENKFLKDHPYFCKNFRMVLIAPSGNGKTQLLYNILFDKTFLLDMVKKSKVVAFIPTTDVVTEMAELAVQNKLSHDSFKIYPRWSEDDCEAEYNKLEKDNINIFIFDDVAFLNNFSNANRRNIIDTLMCAGRHKNLYNIVLSQKYTHLNENMRSNNCNILIFFYGLNMKEHDRIYIEHFSFMDRDNFNNIIKENLFQLYQFIIYNKKNNKIYNHEFDEIVI